MIATTIRKMRNPLITRPPRSQCAPVSPRPADRLGRRRAAARCRRSVRGEGYVGPDRGDARMLESRREMRGRPRPQLVDPGVDDPRIEVVLVAVAQGNP